MRLETGVQGTAPRRSAAPEERLRHLVVQLPDNTHSRFEQLAAEQGVTMSGLCRACVEAALASILGRTFALGRVIPCKMIDTDRENAGAI